MDDVAFPLYKVKQSRNKTERNLFSFGMKENVKRPCIAGWPEIPIQNPVRAKTASNCQPSEGQHL